jgi:hypothetical protein
MAAHRSLSRPRVGRSAVAGRRDDRACSLRERVHCVDVARFAQRGTSGEALSCRWGCFGKDDMANYIFGSCVWMRHAVPPLRPSIISANADGVLRNKSTIKHLPFGRMSPRPIYLGGRRGMAWLSACSLAARGPSTQQCDWRMQIIGPIESELTKRGSPLSV